MPDIASLAYAVDSAQLERATTVLNQHAEAAQRTGAAAANAAKLSSFQIQNLSFQMNDLAVGVASGQSAFRLIAQQGAQIAQIFGPGVGVQAALKQTGTALATFLLNPLNLVVAAFAIAGAAAQYFFGLIFSEGSKSEDILKSINSLVQDIKDSYNDTTDAVKKYNNAAGEGFITQALAKQIELADKLKKSREDMVSGAVSEVFSGMTAGFVSSDTFQGIIDQLGNLHVPAGLLADWENFKEQVKNGTANLTEFREHLDQVAKDFPTRENIEFIDSIMKATQETFDLEQSQRKLAAALHLMLGVATDADKAILGLADSESKLEREALQTEHALLREAHQRAEAEERAAQKITDAKERITEGLDKEILNLKIQIETYGMAAGAIAQYKAEKEALLKADQDHLTLSDAEIQKIKDQAREIGQLTDQLDKLNATREAADSIASAFYNAAKGAQSLSDFAQKAGEAILDAAMQAFLLGQGPLAGFLGTTNQGSLTTLIGQFLKPGTGHSGAMLGVSSGPSRIVPASLFAEAPRGHSGMMLGADEVPFIGLKGERLLNRDETRNYNDRPIEVHNNIRVIDNAGVRITQKQSRTSDGKAETLLMIDAALNDMIERKSPAIKNLERTYGIGRGVTIR